MFSDAFIDALNTDGVTIGYAIRLDLPHETVRTHNGVGSIVVDGYTYKGVGEFGSMGEVKSVGDSNPATVDVGMIGIPSEYFVDVLSNHIRGSDVEIYMLIFTEQGQLFMAESLMFGQITAYSLDLDVEGTISVEVADEFNLYERPLQYFCTHESWKRLHPNDDFWQYVAQLSQREIHWGNDVDAERFTV